MQGDTIRRNSVCRNQAAPFDKRKISPDGKTVTRVNDSGSAAGGIDRLSCVSFGTTIVSNDPNDIFGENVSRVVTAVRTKDGDLKLIVWQVESDGTFTRIEAFGDAAGPISLVRMTSTLSNDIYVTAVRDNNQNLKLITWRIDNQAQPETLSDNIVLYNNFFFENTVQVVAPKSPNLPKGKIVVNLGNPWPQAGFVHRDLLGGTGTSIARTATTALVPFPLDPATQKNAVDNQIIRLIDGSLLALKNGYVWNDLPSPPAWFNIPWIDPTWAAAPLLEQKERNAVFLFRSTDSGQSWGDKPWSVIDSALVENGDYGWPQPDKQDVGGIDRTELYQDPFTGDIYISGRGDGDPSH